MKIHLSFLQLLCAYGLRNGWSDFNTLRTGDANLRLYAYKQFKYLVPNVLTGVPQGCVRAYI
jgi:hypothetical protein